MITYRPDSFKEYFNKLKAKDFAFLPFDTDCNYEVLSTGVIISKKNFPPTPVRTFMEKSGLTVRLYFGNTARYMKVAEIVATCFVENPDPLNLTEVRHKDGNVMNNNWTNLEWVAKKKRKAGPGRPKLPLTDEERKKRAYEQQRKYVKEHPEKTREYARKYYAEHKEQMKEKRKKWMEEHREECLERSRKYYAEHKEQMKEQVRKNYYKKKEEKKIL